VCEVRQQRGHPHRKRSMPSPKSHSKCPWCGSMFLSRSNKQFCSASCRKAASQKDRREQCPANAANSPTTRREQHEAFELAARMAETLYSMPPYERLGYIEEIVRMARTGRSPLLRRVLTNPAFIRPNPLDQHLFFRRCPNYCTISQAADRYCRSSPWNAGVAEVVRGEVPEPPTGEVIDALDSAA